MNPEYDAVKQFGIEPTVSPARQKAYAKSEQLLQEAIANPSRKQTQP